MFGVCVALSFCGYSEPVNAQCAAYGSAEFVALAA